VYWITADAQLFSSNTSVVDLPTLSNCLFNKTSRLAPEKWLQFIKAQASTCCNATSVTDSFRFDKNYFEDSQLAESGMR
jgi:hypothetical protein